MKSTKTKIILVGIIVCIGIFFFTACRPEIEKPDNIPPIDWENYNDVYTIFWNYFRTCPALVNPPPDTIKVYGKIDIGRINIET